VATGTGIGEFFVSLTVDAAEGAATVGSLVSMFGELELATVAEIGVLWELAVRLAETVDQGMKMSLGFEQLTMHTGLSAQELQKWQIVAAQSHATAEDVTGTVEALTKHLANLAIGNDAGALGSLQQLGITAFGAGGKLKDAFQILEEVRHRLKLVTSDAGQQERLLAGLGINANLREELNLSDDLFSKRAGLAHGMGKAQEDAFDRARQQMVDIGLVAKDITLDIGAWTASTSAFVRSLGFILDTMKEIRKFLEGNSDFFKLSPEAMARQKADSDAHVAFFRSLFNPNPRDLSGREQLEELFPRLFGNSYGSALPPEPAGGFGRSAPAVVTIDKHDTYQIHGAHDPEKVKAVIEKHWDETLSKKTIDGFDQQNGNGGY
jgi:hypothetical protein